MAGNIIHRCFHSSLTTLRMQHYPLSHPPVNPSRLLLFGIRRLCYQSSSQSDDGNNIKRDMSIQEDVITIKPSPFDTLTMMKAFQNSGILIL